MLHFPVFQLCINDSLGGKVLRWKCFGDTVSEARALASKANPFCVLLDIYTLNVIKSASVFKLVGCFWLLSFEINYKLYFLERNYLHLKKLTLVSSLMWYWTAWIYQDDLVESNCCVANIPQRLAMIIIPDFNVHSQYQEWIQRKLVLIVANCRLLQNLQLYLKNIFVIKCNCSD